MRSNTTTTQVPRNGHVICDQCGGRHVAEFSHIGDFGQGPIFAVVCTEDDLTDYYRESRVIR
jgi:hypothetical protein